MSARGHALWDLPGVPHKGWKCTGVHDVRDGGTITVDEAIYAHCEMCGRECIRFVHNMVHADYSGTVKVGCVCAGKMENPYAAKAREELAQKRAARRAKWLSRKWRVSSKGNDFLNIDGHNIGVRKNRSGRWTYWIDESFSDGTFPTPNEAKLALFDDCWRRFWSSSTVD